MEQNQVEVEILVQTITAQYGTLNDGDVLRTSAAFADHLVNDCRAARYKLVSTSEEADVQTSAQTAQADQPKQTRRRAAATAPDSEA